MGEGTGDHIPEESWDDIIKIHLSSIDICHSGQSGSLPPLSEREIDPKSKMSTEVRH